MRRVSRRCRCAWFEGDAGALGQGAAAVANRTFFDGDPSVETERGFNEDYLGICAHYGIEPRTINVGRPQENGDCESANGHLNRRIKQHLLLRGSRDFSSEEEYDRFLIGVLESANRLRTKGLGEELAAMSETVIADLPDYREVMVSVRNNSTIRVRK